MQRPAVRRALVSVALGGSVLITGCGGEPEPLEVLPPLAPPDLCALLPEGATTGLVGSASSDESGDPAAACALRGDGGRDVEVLVTWLQLENEESSRVVWESQCNGIDGSRFSERQAEVEGAGETCAGSADEEDADLATLALRRDREVVTVRVTTRDDQGPPSLQRAEQLAAGLLAELPIAR